ncbi:MAG TPA: bifunctional DNA-formamidopyrimidine glycosylase/DNA-(apurinic or apyrimidinic site) lyase [Geopsychrobacteraceae bacterium]|nr:bifunctional DNA-formamidopyrimidine glycosylase/DNA-(apurinic or apyrimidinic site) lyase [Geopsychrobacteraceae bacterium]
MPELPEVETTRRGIEPLISGCSIVRVELRVPKLRWPLEPQLSKILVGQSVLSVGRRAKYLLVYLEDGCLLIHLGMTGNLRVVPEITPANKHDHVDICFAGGQCLRFADPRRFGAVLWTPDLPEDHPLLSRLGPEPLSDEFDGISLHQKSRKRKLTVKQFIMDQKVVVGVGNIYASEALFMAGIRPDRPAGKVSSKCYIKLVKEIKKVLLAALDSGGTTFSDFRQTDGKPGYFKQQLKVYGRAGEACPHCGAVIQSTRLGQRSTFFCPDCQC